MVERNIRVTFRGRQTIAPAVNQSRRLIGRLRKSVARLRSALVGSAGLAGAFAGAFSIFKLAQFVRGSVQAFATQQQAVEELRAALLATGKDGVASLQAITKEAGRLQRITTAADEALIAATASLAQLATGLRADELIKAQKAIVAIADTFLRGDVVNAALLMGKTLGSTTNALTRYGIQVESSASASEKLGQVLAQIAPMFEVSQAKADTLAGRLVQLRNAWGDLREAIGGVLVAGTGFQQQTTDLIDRVRSWTQAIRENQDTWIGWVRVIVSSMRVIGLSISAILRLAFNLGQVLGNLIRGLAGFAVAMVAFTSRSFAVAAAAFREAQESIKLMGVNAADAIDGVSDLGDAVAELSKNLKELGTVGGDVFRRGAAGILPLPSPAPSGVAIDRTGVSQVGEEAANLIARAPAIRVPVIPDFTIPQDVISRSRANIRELVRPIDELKGFIKTEFQGLGRLMVMSIAAGAESVKDLLKRTFFGILGGLLDIGIRSLVGGLAGGPGGAIAGGASAFRSVIPEGGAAVTATVEVPQEADTFSPLLIRWLGDANLRLRFQGGQ